MSNSLKKIINRIRRSRLARRIPLEEDSISIFGREPWAEASVYQKLYESTRKIKYPEIEKFEHRTGFSIDGAWLDKLALHTQVVIKEEPLNWQHGRVVYSALREQIKDFKGDPSMTAPFRWTILETGTARGFSACCMAKALNDAKIDGTILTFDVLPHEKSMIWNCVDDHSGLHSRAEIVRRWPEEVARIIFFRGSTFEHLQRFGIDRIPFAFLDAFHDKKSVLEEFMFVEGRQAKGDRIVFDDVTPGVFDGVVDAVKIIESDFPYKMEWINSSDDRGYVVAKRIF
jgi:hypothetical protein